MTLKSIFFRLALFARMGLGLLMIMALFTAPYPVRAHMPSVVATTLFLSLIAKGNARPILFHRLTGSHGEIYTLDPNTLIETQLFDTDSPWTIYEPEEWSPDSLHVVFTLVRYGTWGDLYAVNADGSGLLQLTNSPYDSESHPEWSPDGQRMAFVNFESQVEVPKIYVINRDGSGLTYLTAGNYPRWSPDGTRIAFIHPENGEINLIIIDGTGQFQLTNTGVGVYANEWNWSPDGQTIAFTWWDNWYFSTEISVIDTDGANLTQLTDTSAESHFSQWSPDGRQLLFSSNRDGHFEIYVMDADGANETRLTDTPLGNFGPFWSSDGKQIAFTSYRDHSLGEIYIMNADGSEQIRLTYNTAFDFLSDW